MRKLIAALVMIMCLIPVFSAQGAEKTDMEHYLLIGVDEWGANEEGSARSDAIILASLDYGRDRMTFTSFARDSIVTPSYRKGAVKLNAVVRSEEGEQALVDYLQETYGLPISGYFVINFSGAVDVIDVIGGIEVELSAAEKNYLRQRAGDYDGYKLTEGLCRINGAQALYYMRCRLLDNDFGRQGRQGKVLRAVLKELGDITPMRALTLLDDVLGLYRTDLSIAAQLELAMKAITLRDAQVRTYSIPAEGTYRYSSDSHGASGLEFNLEQNQTLLYEQLGIPAPKIEEKQAPHAS